MSNSNIILIEEDVLLIDKFINGELNVDETAKFESRLNIDHNFAKQYEFIINVKNELSSSKKSSLLTTLGSLEEKYQSRSHIKSDDLESPKESNKKSAKFKKLRIGLGLIAAIGLVLLMVLPQNNSTDYENLVLEVFEPYPSHIIKRSVDQDISKLKNNAYKYYSIEAYQKAIPLLEQLKSEGDESVSIHLFSAYLGATKFIEAQKELNLLINNGKIHKDTLSWYQALIHVGQKEVGKAKPILEELKRTTQYKQKIIILERSL